MKSFSYFKVDGKYLFQSTRLCKARLGMVRNQLVISVRASLVSYALKLLQIDPNKCESKPEAQQIVVDNMEELQRWMINRWQDNS